MAGTVASCHDLSDGGLAVAAAESAFAGGCGMKLDLSLVLWKGDVVGKNDATLLFSESASRHLVTVHPEQRDEFETIMTGNCFASIGVVTAEQELTITGLSGDIVISSDLAGLKNAWQATLREL
jgi:phosphoribosylformylglycinamidine synthase